MYGQIGSRVAAKSAKALRQSLVSARWELGAPLPRTALSPMSSCGFALSWLNSLSCVRDVSGSFVLHSESALDVDR